MERLAACTHLLLDLGDGLARVEVLQDVYKANERNAMANSMNVTPKNVTKTCGDTHTQ